MSAKRKAVSARVRFEVFQRDGFRCQYCGASPDQCRLEVDHVIPVSDGGTNGFGNLVTACALCNAGKAASTTVRADGCRAAPEVLKVIARSVVEHWGPEIGEDDSHFLWVFSVGIEECVLRAPGIRSLDDVRGFVGFICGFIDQFTKAHSDHMAATIADTIPALARSPMTHRAIAISSFGRHFWGIDVVAEASEREGRMRH